MKLKTFIAIVVSSIFAVSFAYAAAPVTADSTATPDPSSMAAAPSDDDTMNTNTPDNDSVTPDSSNNVGTSNNNDDISADTATGDDDY